MGVLGGISTNNDKTDERDNSAKRERNGLSKNSHPILAHYLKDTESYDIRVIGGLEDNGVVKIPSGAFRLLVESLEHFSKGNAVEIISIPDELTAQEAAYLLNVSKPFFIKLLEEGKIPYYKTGAYHKILFKDLLDFYHKHQREGSMDELTALSQEFRFRVLRCIENYLRDNLF